MSMELGGVAWFIHEPLLRSLLGTRDTVRQINLPPVKGGPLPQAAEPFSRFNSVSPVFKTLEQCGPHSVLGQTGCPGVTH